jgi:hypothetical protein
MIKIFCWLSFITITSFGIQDDRPVLKLRGNSVWRDSSDMVFKVVLLNQSGSTALVLDQVLDDYYNDRPSFIDNLYFVVERFENGHYDIHLDKSFVNSIYADWRSPRELLDSISKIRDPYIKLNPADSLFIDYSFQYGHFYKKGKYRIKARFIYDYSVAGKFTESDWFYFEVKNDQLIHRVYIRPPQMNVPLFWQKSK